VAQTAGSRSTTCLLAGSYRLNVGESDKLYPVVKDASSTVPFGDQQRFFMDLSTWLTPPDILAIECEVLGEIANVLVTLKPPATSFTKCVGQGWTACSGGRFSFPHRSAKYFLTRPQGFSF
jgi:hypothetical protein